MRFTFLRHYIHYTTTNECNIHCINQWSQTHLSARASYPTPERSKANVRPRALCFL